MSRVLRRFILLMLMILVLGVLTYFVSRIGIGDSRSTTLILPLVTQQPPLPGTEVARFFQIDPAIIAFLDNNPRNTDILPVDALGMDIQPIGVYLPRSGNTQFELALQATALPTPLPYPTSPPLPLPYVPELILPTVAPFTEDGTPRTEPYTIAPNADCAPSGNPVEGILTQRFHASHSGIDIAAPLSTPVLSTQSGQVTYADWSEIGYGYLVIIQSGAFITYYAHNTSFNVSVGQLVGRGSIVAWSGNTGNSSGPHVHYETRINDVPVDPLTFESRGYPSC